MATRNNGFEALADGVVITALNSGGGGESAFDSVVNSGTGTLTARAAQHAHGARSLEVVHPAGSTVAEYVNWDFPARDEAWARVYYRHAGAPAQAFKLVAFWNGTNIVASTGSSASLVVTTTGALRPQNSAGTSIGVVSSALTAGQWYRVEFHVAQASGTVDVWVWTGATLDSNNTGDCVYTQALTAQTTANQPAAVRFGVANQTVAMASSYTFHLDDAAYDVTARVGPAAVPYTAIPPPALAAAAGGVPVPGSARVAAAAHAAASTGTPGPGVVLSPPAAAAAAAVDTPVVVGGVTPPPPPPPVVVEEAAPEPGVPRLTRNLGCGSYDAWILPRGGGAPILTMLPVTAGEWHRGEDQTTTAKVTLSGLADAGNRDCCRGLQHVHTYQHELALVRDDGEVWVGTLVSKEASGVDEVTLTAMDLTVWFSIRVLHEKHVWADADLSVIFNDAVEDGMRPDPSPNLIVAATPCGVTDTRTVLAKERVHVSSIIGELARIGIDYTAIRRTILAGGTTIPGDPFATLTDEHLAPQTTTEDGLQQANLWYVLGEGGRGNGVNWGEVSATDFITRDGLIERVVKESGIKTQRAAKAAARTRLRATENPPVVIDGGRLLPSAPVAMTDLIPGRAVGLSLSETCVPVVDTLRLATVDVTFAKQQGGAYEENVDVTFQPLGTLAGEVAEE